MSARRGKKGPPAGAEAVKVVVRCRPMSSQEESDGRERVVDMDAVSGTVALRKPNTDAVKTFTFDAVYDWNTTQRQIYEESARPIVEAAMEGFNGTIFAYGQTGTGKTFTMEGVYDQRDLRGIIPNCFAHIFDAIGDCPPEVQYFVRASYLEIYNEEVRDLLSKNYVNPLQLREDPEKGVYVKNLSAFVVKSTEEIDQVMQAGKKNRVVGATKMNLESSRSHSIFTITVECSEPGPDGDNRIRVGKLNLVDLAGSERQTKTGAEGGRLTEAININKSLTALGNVISALVDAKSKHVPYRDSKLTRLLQNSLGGNSKTVMIANMGPADYNYDESISTLRYANRAKQIKNKPKINEDPKDAMLRQFQEEIERLRAQLAAAGVDGEYVPPSGSAPGAALDGGDYGGMSDAALAEVQAQIEKEREQMNADIDMTEEEKRRVENALKARQDELQEEKQKRDAVVQKLAAMEAKVLVGGVNLIDLQEKQERQLEAAQIEIERQQREEERLRRELESQREEVDLRDEEYASLQEEVDIKTRKLKKLWSKLQVAKNEICDLEEEHAREIMELSDEIRAQNRDLAMCKLIMDAFIPPDELNKIIGATKWIEETQEYIVLHQELAGNNVDHLTLDMFANGVGGGMGGGGGGGPEDSPNRFKGNSLTLDGVYGGDAEAEELESAPGVDVGIANVYLSYSGGAGGNVYYQ